MSRASDVLNKSEQVLIAVAESLSDKDKVAALLDALMELRDLASSGSEEMAIIDEVVKKVGAKPLYKAGR